MTKKFLKKIALPPFLNQYEFEEQAIPSTKIYFKAPKPNLCYASSTLARIVARAKESILTDSVFA